MNISFKTRKLQKICSQKTEMVRAVGADCAKKLQQRMSELWAASSLSDISHLPPARLHALVGDRKNTFSVDLKHPYRLLFTVADDLIPYLEDGGIDKGKVLSVEIVEICDTHG
jgi:proteic killer suppression protein